MGELGKILLAYFKTTILPMISKVVREAVNEAIKDHPSLKHAQKEEFFLAEQAAEYLKLSMSKLYKLTASGELPTYGKTKPFYLKRSDLDAYMGQPRTLSKQQVSQEIDELLSAKRK